MPLLKIIKPVISSVSSKTVSLPQLTKSDAVLMPPPSPPKKSKKSTKKNDEPDAIMKQPENCSVMKGTYYHTTKKMNSIQVSSIKIHINNPIHFS